MFRYAHRLEMMDLTSVVLTGIINIQVYHSSNGNTEIVFAEVLVIDKHQETAVLTNNRDNKLLSWSEWHPPFSLFLTPVATYPGVANHTVLIKARVEVKDYVISSFSTVEVEIKPARVRCHSSDIDHFTRLKIWQLYNMNDEKIIFSIQVYTIEPI